MDYLILLLLVSLILLLMVSLILLLLVSLILLLLVSRTNNSGHKTDSGSTSMFTGEYFIST